MAKADRLERLDERRRELEAEYHDALVAALRKTAAGHWGLFGHRPDRQTQALILPTIDALKALAEDIDDSRMRLNLEPFALHAEFLAARGPASPSAMGEPKQAKAWLLRLGVSESA